MKSVVVLSLGVLCAWSFASIAADVPKPNPYQARLQAVPAAELPAKAAQIVKEGKGHKDTTVSVVKAAVEINPAAAPAVVGGIARAVPDAAADAAAVAAAEQPKLAAAIARAAAGGAPAKAGKIVTAVCKAVPNQFRAIAIAVAEVVPGASKEILDGVALAIPQLKSSIEAATTAVVNGSGSVALTLDQATISVARKDTPGTPVYLSPAVVRGPAVGPPYIPLSGTPTNVTPGTGGEVPPGGRNYAAP